MDEDFDPESLLVTAQTGDGDDPFLFGPYVYRVEDQEFVI